MDRAPELRPWWKRIPVRLSLRASMLLVLVLAVPIGWKANRARTQRRAVEAILANKGSVVYDFQYTGDDVLVAKPRLPNKEPAAPKWLRNLIGDEYFQEVTMANIPSVRSAEVFPSLAKLDHLVFLNVDGMKVDDNALSLIAKVPNLQALSLAQTSISDAGIANLVGARRLRRLSLHGASGVTDAGMASLAKLPDLKSFSIYAAPRLTDLGLKNLGPTLAGLETLILYQTSITDEGMSSLEACRNLKTLSLPGAKIGDLGIAHLRNLDSLETLILNSTEITDEGLSSLGGLRKLRALSLFKTGIVGPGLTHLEMMAGLESLTLDGSKLTDQGLDPIRKLKGLKALRLRGTQVSPEAVAALQAERPTLRIDSGPMPPIPAAPPPSK